MVKAFIYTETGTSIQDQCRGSSPSGGCPRSQPGAAVVCAGRKIVLAARGEIPAFALFVEPDARVCPLAVLNLCGDDLPAAASPGRAAAALRQVRQRGERAAASLVGWRRAIREVLPTAGRTIQPQEGGD